MNEYDLLKAFRDERSEKAFAELVRRYAGLVYSVAKRRLANATLAEDITQIVFIRLAKTPPKAQSDAELAAWLHRTTVYVTIDTWRSETRRRNREKQTIVMEPTTSENTLWEELSPNLDEALNQLNDDDRHALVLRFFGRKTMRDVGTALGVSEDAAKMRVSRALDRMRTQLGVGGATCTAAVLESILDERSVQAAPAQLVSRLSAMKLPAAAGAVGMIKPLGAFLRTSKFNLATGALVLAVIVVSIVQLARSFNGPASKVAMANAQTNLTGKTTGMADRKRFDAGGLNAPIALPPKPVRMLFHVVDAETGEGLANAKLDLAYFRPGVGAHEVRANDNGDASVPIPQPEDATQTYGMLAFVVAEKHVPKVVDFHGVGIPANYTMKLDPAMTAGGLVADEQGLPVDGVKIGIEEPGNKYGQAENVNFQTCPVTSHDDGSWSCSYIPMDCTKIRFFLEKPGYAATFPVVPVARVDLTNLVLVINRGFTVTGQITDWQNRPVANARIKTLHGHDHYPLHGHDYNSESAKTDEHGIFMLAGLAGDTEIHQEPAVEINDSGGAIIRGLAGVGPLHVDLAVQAEEFAPQTSNVELHGITNVANFTLSPGNIFRGRVVDEAGNPISNAIIRTDFGLKNQIAESFDWTSHTDGNGRFEWDSAPAEKICYSFYADGYGVTRGMPLLADGSDHEITLKHDTQNEASHWYGDD
jgi:RNA polymerase sigma factor (sigma-70 family)